MAAADGGAVGRESGSGQERNEAQLKLAEAEEDGKACRERRRSTAAAAAVT